MYLKIAKKLEKIYSVDIYDHLVEKINLELKLTRDENYKKTSYDAVIIGSKHNEYKKMIFKSYLNKSAVIMIFMV